jgi:hypothetical protein
MSGHFRAVAAVPPVPPDKWLSGLQILSECGGKT